MAALPTAQAQSSTAAAEARVYDIPAGPLATVLTRYAEAAGAFLAGGTQALEGLTSPGLRGRHTLESGFRALLQGSGYAIEATSAGFVLIAAPATGPSSAAARAEGRALAPITVTGSADAESASGPVLGYRAQRSAAGSKTDTPLIETPQSVTVMSRELLRDLAVQDVAESLHYVPGASGGEDGRDGFGAIRLRGFPQSAYTLRDGLRQNAFNIIPQDPYGLERIETWRGPASVLFGQVGPGGVVNLVSKRPTSAPQREFNVAGGSHGYKQVSGDVSDALDADGRLRFRLVGRLLDRDDAADFVDEKRQVLDPSLTWQLGERTRWTLLGGYTAVEAVRLNTLPIQGTLQPNPNGRIPLSRFIGDPDFDLDDKQQWQLASLFEHRIDETWTLRQNLRHTRFEADTRTTFSLGIDPGLRLLNRRPVLRDYDGRITTLDHQVQGRWLRGSSEHTLLLGIDHLRDRQDELRFNGTMEPLDLFAPVYGVPALIPDAPSSGNTRHGRQTGLYAQHQAKFDQRWVLLLGGRHDRARGETINRLSGVPTRTSDESFTGRAGVVYLAASGFAPYLSFSQSFLPVGGTAADGTPFDPEEGEQTELGLKYESTDKRFGASVAIYQLLRQNVPTVDPNDASNRIQVGEQRHRGLELEAAGELTRRLSAFGGFSLIDARFTKDNTLDANGDKLLEGKRPTRVPARSAGLWLKYDLAALLPAGMAAGLGARYVGGVRGNAANSFEVPSYTVWDAGLYYEQPRWSLSLTVKNVADRDYYAAGTSDSNVVVGDPRTALATLSLRW